MPSSVSKSPTTRLAIRSVSPVAANALSPRELASATGVSTDTLRHYERRGLLPAPHRTASGYRRYRPESITRVQLIQRALVIGFSLADLARVFKERALGDAPCQSVHQLVSDRLAQLDQQLRDLTALRAELATLLGDWSARLAVTAPGHRAHLLDTLASRPQLDRPHASKRPPRR
jgi:DNA-binding transcriptional MerR regulator